MGYRSYVVIAVHRQAFTQALLQNNIPALLKGQPDTTTDDALYWEFDQIKWYPEYPIIHEVEGFFLDLDGYGPILGPDSEPLTMGSYGGIRLGEDTDDNEFWGEPWEYGITMIRDIEWPRPSSAKPETATGDSS